MGEIRFRAALEDVLSGRSLPVMHYQPIADLQRGVVVGYEALVRFPAPPQLPPDKWFQSAEVRGKRVALETLVARMAILAREDLPPDTFLSINVSPLFLMSPEGAAMFAEMNDLSRLVFEITEGDKVADYGGLRSRLDVMRDRGASIAVDDTGSGYASMKHVMELRPQFVKLDRFFIDGCHLESAKSAMIEMIGEAADRIDAWLVAEGIENEHEASVLIKQCVPLGQGYFLGRPAPQMLPLSPAARETIRIHAKRGNGEGLFPHLTVASTCTSREEAENTAAHNAHGVCSVLLDQWERPLALFENHPLLGVRSVPDMMCVYARSTVEQVLRRTLARPLARRFDTIVAISEKGVYEGLVRIDDLAHSVLPKRKTRE
jgi:EAL domain-containing protein (putative c-di-GMP-specific phosphodiesterase class I)